MDELTLSSGAMPDDFDEHTCDFDTPHICGYTRTTDAAEHAWVRRDGLTSVALNDTGPTVDKSQNAPHGEYETKLPS